MQEHDARTLRGAALPTAVVGVVALIAGFAISGTQGLYGALFGTLLVIGAFAVSAFVISWTGGRRPELLLPVAFLVYTTKFAILMVALMFFRDTTALDKDVFGWTALACVLVWLAAHAVAVKRSRQPTIVPADEEGEKTAEDSEAHR
ncbi:MULTISPECIES: hypothetical protein [Nocardiopsis]|jgi:ATP synthase protein I|uniref:ATP synthase protein I n=1 Tax=Nocardiopsis sinuspersici TaxID=501010 RepID=A0A1V3BW15_9ACTN|nr:MULTISPECIES: hypothetical protein [Nocardiopsis]NYH53766.1 ATP synthase protein I [Nocardiopsis sinuspersici]OOC52695.1 hypothetical protein NOSIN_01660 [Nocardiopsis sinuspersici]